MADPIIKYVGGGGAAYHSGIPARDLSKADYAALDTDQRAIVRQSLAYDYLSFKSAGDKATAKDATASAKAAAPDVTASAPVQKPAPTA